MSSIYGLLGLNDNEYAYLNTLGQQLVYDASSQYLMQVEADTMSMLGVFVEETTENFKERYKLPGGGRMQQMSGQSQAGAVKSTGRWDVAYPLYDFGDQVATDRIDFAYATARDLQVHLESIRVRYINTVRYEVLKSLFDNTQRTFVDSRHGSLSIEPLANGDTVVYPPVLGSESEATEDHYIETGYAASAISDTNDPYVTAVDELEEHFGAVTGGGEIVVFVNNAQRAKTEGLTDFTPTSDRFIQEGDQTAIPLMPGMGLPGRTLGRHGAGAWVQEWRWIPADYMVAVHLMAPKPLKRRVHPSVTGLPTGLSLVSDSSLYPFTQSHFEAHFGFGGANRLNGVVLELGTGGTYSIPSAYS